MVAERSSAAIEVFSSCNEWIDAVFLVPWGRKEEAIEILKEAYDFFWSDEGEAWCYGDLLEARLREAGIEYEVFYANIGDGEEEVE